MRDGSSLCFSFSSGIRREKVALASRPRAALHRRLRVADTTGQALEASPPSGDQRGPAASRRTWAHSGQRARQGREDPRKVKRRRLPQLSAQQSSRVGRGEGSLATRGDSWVNVTSIRRRHLLGAAPGPRRQEIRDTAAFLSRRHQVPVETVSEFPGRPRRATLCAGVSPRPHASNRTPAMVCWPRACADEVRRSVGLLSSPGQSTRWQNYSVKAGRGRFSRLRADVARAGLRRSTLRATLSSLGNLPLARAAVNEYRTLHQYETPADTESSKHLSSVLGLLLRSDLGVVLARGKLVERALLLVELPEGDVERNATGKGEACHETVCGGPGEVSAGSEGPEGRAVSGRGVARRVGSKESDIQLTTSRGSPDNGRKASPSAAERAVVKRPTDMTMERIDLGALV